MAFLMQIWAPRKADYAFANPPYLRFHSVCLNKPLYGNHYNGRQTITYAPP